MIKADGSYDELLVYPEDTIFYDGVYYGDWSIFDKEAFGKPQFQISVFQQDKAMLSEKSCS